MQVQVNTDRNVDGGEKFDAYVRRMVESALERFSDRVTRVEVHIGDENANKGGQGDKRCMMEARLEGRQPSAVTHHSNTVEDAVDGAAAKLERLVAHTLDKLRDVHAHAHAPESMLTDEVVTPP